MKKTRYTEEQIAFALRQAESGTAVAEVIRKMGITEPTFYRWKKQFAGMGVTEIAVFEGRATAKFVGARLGQKLRQGGLVPVPALDSVDRGPTGLSRAREVLPRRGRHGPQARAHVVAHGRIEAIDRR